jgi:hypothetical protein
MKGYPEDTSVGCEDCRKATWEPTQYDGMQLCAECLAEHVTEEKVDPADVMIVSGYWANMPQYAIDEIWMRGGKVHVAISLRHRSAEDPPDTTIYRMERRERNVDGADVECIEFDEVGWVDGTKHEWSDE